MTSDRSMDETKEYFSKLGHTSFLSFDELILQSFEQFGEVAGSAQSEVEKFNAEH